MAPNLDCRMYEQKFPEIDTPVMVQVKSINPDTCAYVLLLEYNIEGMLSFTELSRRRIRSVLSLIRVGRVEPLMVLHVDREKGFVNLTKRRVSEDDARTCEEKFNKSKHVHSIMRHVAETMDIDLEAFKLIVSDPDSVLDPLTRRVEEINADGQKVTKVVPAISDEVKKVLVQNIKRRMTPHVLKIRADIEMRCFELDGILHIKNAMRKAEAAGNKDCPVKISLVGSPLYVLNTQTFDKEQGIETLNKAIAACTEEMDHHKGRLVVKTAPRPMSEREDKLFAEQIARLNLADDDVSSGDDTDDDGGMKFNERDYSRMEDCY
ncbi:eukaryotic translation initiation factor 2 subunit alpha homolog isoform X2 [Primulina huaijiensis]|uniref:eukaryotic translation initiation factor 2 subunit alpha homolog isoform X2 n=1 Tax=Primulina huaijiensis TaxID=1492673 RepID=UPI003CC71E53